MSKLEAMRNVILILDELDTAIEDGMDGGSKWIKFTAFIDEMQRYFRRRVELAEAEKLEQLRNAAEQ